MIIKFLEGCFHHSCEIVEKEETTPQCKHVPSELIHHIQSLLPAKDAARTCVLSKSWLHAWSTIATLRFTKCDSLKKKEVTDYIKLIDRTILRYLNNNLSIECFHLHLDIYNWPSLAYKWIQALASRNALKELCLTICCKKIADPDYYMSYYKFAAEIVCESLNTISIVVDDRFWPYPAWVYVNLVIKSPFLRVLELVNVRISSEDTLNNIICSCSLLERIKIILTYHDFEIIMVKNLRCLRELRIEIADAENNNFLEIYDVPILHLLHYHAEPEYTFKMNSLGSVRELVLFHKVVDDTFTDMIKSNFPFLESLTLTMFHYKLKTITCDTLKRLTLKLLWNKEQINIQVYASRLLFFSYDGQEMPSLKFPANTPEHITLILNFNNSDSIDISFFLKMREALSLSSNFDIEIKDLSVRSLNIDLDDLRRRVKFPTRNVQQLSFKQIIIWQHSTLLDLFFSICYPLHVKANYRHKGYGDSKMMLRRMMKKTRHPIKDIEIRNPHTEKWETLTNSWSSIPDEYDGCNSDDQFRLSWCSCKNLKRLVHHHLLFHYQI